MFHSSRTGWTRWDSNPQPSRCHRVALPLELQAQVLNRPQHHVLVLLEEADALVARRTQQSSDALAACAAAVLLVGAALVIVVHYETADRSLHEADSAPSLLRQVATQKVVSCDTVGRSPLM